ncbi:MAG: acyl-CoA synthetase [Candidatus Promineifilaceae bacterium]
MNIYEMGLDKTPANYTPLSPLSFLPRSARTHPNHLSAVHGERRYTWSQTYERCRRLASALVERYGIGLGDTVTAMCFNTPEMMELHFAVPMTGAVLHSLNTRLDAQTVGFMLNHAETKVVFSDRELSSVMSEALQIANRPIAVIDVDDVLAVGGELIGETDYERLVATGDPEFAWEMPADEWQAITLNYTSGTTGNPKGVVYHHRGAYLNAISNVVGWDLAKHPVYLWTLPMFHCNGWCFPWTLAAVTGTSICLRKVDVNDIYRLISEEEVTHYCGAPIVHSMLANASAELRALKQQFVKGMIAAAPPPAVVLQAMQENEFDITHVYGLTETYGPAVVCEWHAAWNELPIEEQADIKARQGVPYHMLHDLQVLNPETMEPVPADGKTLGEVMFKGNVVMKGYLKNPGATEAAFADGWFHSGDLGVMYPDGYIQLKDRSKDIIISGGENISTIEVESTLFRHPSVIDAAVVAKPDEKWGETPCAFVTLREGSSTTAAELIAYCRNNMARFKAPRHIVFGTLPKTSTGKTQKFALRERAKEID